MYLDYYGFLEKPFNLTPDPRFVFLSKTHKEAFAHLLYGIDHRAGFIGLTGEVGTGKTTVLRTLLGQLDSDHYRTALIFNPCLSAPELLQNINRELGISAPVSNNSGSLDALNLFLLQQNSEGRTVVLIIDEAQNLEAPVLEQIRLISNLETSREKLIQIVLSGQPEFLQVLNQENMRQLSQRIIVRYHLQPMDFQDTVQYISHRLEVAGGKNGIRFSVGALKRIYRYSGGFPRLINAACDRALMAAYSKDLPGVNSRVASAGIKDMNRNKTVPGRKRRLILIPALAVLASLILAGLYWIQPDFLPTSSLHNRPTGEQAKKDAPVTDGAILPAFPAGLEKLSEAESGRRAFNILSGLWNLPSVPENLQINSIRQMELAALGQKCRSYRFSGNMGALLRIDCPAILELEIPGIPGKRFISLLGIENGQLLVDLPVSGKRSLSFGEIEKYWSGQALIFWKDPLSLLTSEFQGSKKDQIGKLQELLKEAGIYHAPLTGVYDGATVSAIKEFQASMGIEQDGIAGGQTLMFLYHSIHRFKVPRLTTGQL